MDSYFYFAFLINSIKRKSSFDCHDSSVYTSRTVTGLLEHYKDPGCVMFFEPALTIPLNRNFVFSLQQLCRATIVSHTTYDGINEICLPKKLKSYLKEYHYKQHVRVKRFDEPIYGTSWIWCFITVLFFSSFFFNLTIYFLLTSRKNMPRIFFINNDLRI